MAKIAVDVDDTLYSFTDEAREQLSLMVDEEEYAPYQDQLLHALYAKWDQWRTPFELCGSDSEGKSLWVDHCIARCHDDEAILRQQPFNGSVEVCTELVDAGHELVYISNRATETESATEQWLIDNDFPYGEGIGHLVVTNGDKRPFIKDCQYQIDDRVKNVLEFVYDYDYETTVRTEAARLKSYGPNQIDPEWDDFDEILSGLIELSSDIESEDAYLWEVVALKERRGELLERLQEVSQRASDRYLKENSRKAFVRVADYNGGLTDVPGLYLAHTWAGLRRYMVKSGLLPKKSLVSA